MINDKSKSVVFSQKEDKSLKSKESNYKVDNRQCLTLNGNIKREEEAFSKMDILNNLKEKNEKVKKIKKNLYANHK